MPTEEPNSLFNFDVGTQNDFQEIGSPNMPQERLESFVRKSTLISLHNVNEMTEMVSIIMWVLIVGSHHKGDFIE